MGVRMLGGMALLLLTAACGFAQDADGLMEGTTVRGFVDASYFAEMNSQSNTFGLDQAEVDLERTWNEYLVVRADLQWVSDGAGGFSTGLEQGYLQFQLPAAPVLTWTFGKFNAPMGFEMLDPHEMYQYSHAYVFDYGLPTNLTGAMLGYASEVGFSVSGWVVNGWDANVEDNKNFTGGGRLQYDHEDMFSVGVSSIIGVESWAGNNMVSVYDFDATITAVEKLTVGLEFNFGSIDLEPEASTWMGYLVMIHYDFNEWAGATLRYDSLDDTDGSRFMTGGETRNAVTIAPTFVLGGGMGALVEYKYEMSDLDAWLDSDGQPTDTNNTIAFEMTYTF
ncbi:outer membrane beta-barrel protein [bacterium]|nr:outer membrane beta-barrel protein [bacterium]